MRKWLIDAAQAAVMLVLIGICIGGGVALGGGYIVGKAGYRIID